MSGDVSDQLTAWFLHHVERKKKSGAAVNLETAVTCAQILSAVKKLNPSNKLCAHLSPQTTHARRPGVYCRCG